MNDESLRWPDRNRHPRSALWLALAASVAATLAVLAAAARWLGHEPIGWAVALGLFALVTGFVVRGLGEQRPHRRLGAPNVVTLCRAGLVCALAGAAPLGEPPTWPLWLVAGLAALLDAVDGWLARRAGLCSRFGARFDLEIDALLVLVLALLAWRTGQTGAWILLAGAMRYGFVLAAAPWPWLGSALPPSMRRKVICVVQVVSLLLCLLPGLPAPLASALGAIGLLALAGSFAIDIRWLWLARHEAHDGHDRHVGGGDDGPLPP